MEYFLREKRGRYYIFERTVMPGESIVAELPLIFYKNTDFDLGFAATSDEVTFATVEAAKEAGYATLNYGGFITAIINFLIMAFVIFLLVKTINKVSEIGKKKEEETPAEPTTKVCPFCQSEISIKAVKCPNCTSDIPEEA